MRDISGQNWTVQQESVFNPNGITARAQAQFGIAEVGLNVEWRCCKRESRRRSKLTIRQVFLQSPAKVRIASANKREIYEMSNQRVAVAFFACWHDACSMSANDYQPTSKK
jgi:hypothetical protein